MKRIVSLLILAVMCTALFASCSSGEAHMGFQIVSTDVNDFVLEAPSDWIITSQNGYACARAPGYGGDESNVSATSFQMVEGLTTPEEYFETAIVKNFSEPNSMNIISRDVDCTLGEKNAKKYVYTLDMYGRTYKYQMVVCAYASRIYVFTYTSTEEFYEAHELEVEYIVDYFNFKV